MKKVLIIAIFCLSFSTAFAALPTPKNPENFNCVSSQSATSKKLQSMIDDLDNDIVILKSIASISQSLGYGWLKADSIVKCSNENSEGVDFELLRKFTINSLYRMAL